MALTPKENFLRAFRRDRPEWVPYAGEGVVVEVIPHEWNVPRLDEAGAEARDAWGVVWRQADPRVSPYVVESPLKTVADMRRYEMPDPTRESLLDGPRAAIAELADRADNLLWGVIPPGPFTRACTLLGMENLLGMMLTDPDEVSPFIGRIADNDIALARRLIELGLDIGGVSDDYGTTQALIMSPAAWRAIIKPHLARIYAVYKEAGCLMKQHSCGNVTEIIPDLIEIGLDILNPLQAGALDHAAIKARFGDRLMLWGGVDVRVLMAGTPAAVVEEVKRRLRILAPGGGYVCAHDQALPWPEANWAAYLDAVRRYGRYPISIGA